MADINKLIDTLQTPAPSDAPNATPPDRTDQLLQMLNAPPADDVAAPTSPSASPQWKDLLGNIPGSAVETAKSMAYPFMHPIDTAKGVYKIATDAPTRAAVADFYKQRYGGLDALHDTLIKDPVGAVTDLATLLSGTGELTGLEAVGAAGRAIDPLNIAAKGVSAAGKAAGKVAEIPAAVLGITTTAGPAAVKQAAKSGYAGESAFIKSAWGNADPTAVLDDVDSGLNKISKNAQDEYKAKFPNASTPIDTAPITDAYNKFVDSLKTPQGDFKISAPEQKDVRAMGGIINNFTTGKTPDVVQLDGLKQRLSNEFGESSPQITRGATTVNNAIRGQITATAPEYANVMQKYGDAKDMIKDIRKTLSQTQNSSVDTKMGKLNKTLNDTVAGARGQQLIGALEDASGKPISAQIAGQRMSSWLPFKGDTKAQFSAGVGAGLGGLALSHFIPAAAAAAGPWAPLIAPMFSPRAVGTAAYGAGYVAGAPGRSLTAVGMQGAPRFLYNTIAPSRAELRAGLQVGRPMRAIAGQPDGQ